MGSAELIGSVIVSKWRSEVLRNERAVRRISSSSNLKSKIQNVQCKIKITISQLTLILLYDILLMILTLD